MRQGRTPRHCRRPLSTIALPWPSCSWSMAPILTRRMRMAALVGKLLPQGGPRSLGASARWGMLAASTPKRGAVAGGSLCELLACTSLQSLLLLSNPLFPCSSFRCGLGGVGESLPGAPIPRTAVPGIFEAATLRYCDTSEGGWLERHIARRVGSQVVAQPDALSHTSLMQCQIACSCSPIRPFATRIVRLSCELAGKTWSMCTRTPRQMVTP